MASIKIERLQQRIKEVMGHLIAGLQDPRLEEIPVTVTRVELSGDLRYAWIAVATPIEGEAAPRTLIRALEHAEGFLQSELAARLDTRVTPKIQFQYDESIDNQFRIESILNELASERGERPIDPIPDYEVLDPDEASE